MNQKSPQAATPPVDRIFKTETVGFEPTCRLPDNLISSQARYGHFDTSPCVVYSITYF